MEVRELVGAAGVDGRRLRHALTLLCDGQWWTLGDLVRETATSRRGIEALLRAVELERYGERFRIPLAHTPEYQDLLAMAPGPEDPVGHLVPHYRHVLERLETLIAKAPRGRHTLDHVAATPETVLRRALLLGARFWLPGSRLLCVGDHDLTSLAVRMVHPEVEVTVVDIDDRILAYLDEQDLGVRTRWADLRLGLPGSVGEHDLAITDPPYTPEGIGLFVARGLEGLKGDGRVLLAYGASERTPALALKVQNALSSLNLAYEAIYPDFNRYFGAEAIGSAADLYILRPTTKTAPAVAARLESVGTAIYTQGPQSVEADTGQPAVELGDFEPDLLVGDWPKGLPQPRVKLGTWLAKPYLGKQGTVAIAVPAGLEAALPRLVLAAQSAHIRLYLPEPLTSRAHLEALGPLAEIDVRGAVVDVTRRTPDDPAGRIAHRILSRGHGKIANAWREALITESGGSLTKNEARTLIRRAAPWADDLTPVEAPLHRLTSLPTAIDATLT